MRYICITIITALICSCTVKKLVKKQETPAIDNTKLELVVPLVSNPVQTDDTNNIAIILGTGVMVLCFLPLVLLYTGLVFRWIYHFIKKTLIWRK